MQERFESSYEAFAAEAEACCRLLQTMDAAHRESLWRVRLALTSLYAAGVNLPEMKAPVDLDRSRRLKAADEGGQRLELFRRWRRDFPRDAFRVVFNPLSQDEPVTGSLADCLADIWQDLWPGLSALQADDGADGALRAEVWRHWKSGFDDHWGKHALEALYLLHWLALEDI